MAYEITSAKQKAKNVANQFKEQYCPHGRWVTYDSWKVQPEQMHQLILDCDGTPSAISEVMGNDSWVRETCGECGDYSSPVALIQVDYESGARVCLPCLRIIVADLEQRTKTGE